MVDIAGFRFEELHAQTVMAAENTCVYDLPRRGFLSGILMRIHARTASGVTNAINLAHVTDHMDKINLVVNGSYDIAEVDGRILQAQAFYNSGISPFGKWREYATNHQYDTLFLPLGDKPFDPDAMLPLSGLDSIQLKVTNGLDSTNWSNPTIEVYIVITDKEIPGHPITGFYKTEEWRKWTTVNDAYTYLEFPTEHHLRRIILMAEPPTSSNAYTTGYENMMNEIKYRWHSGGTTIFDKNLYYLTQLNAFQYQGAAFTSMGAYRAAGARINTALGERVGTAGIAVKDGDLQADKIPTVDDSDDAHLMIKDYQGSNVYNLMCRGLGLHFTGVLRHDQFAKGRGLPHLQDIKSVLLDTHVRSGSEWDDGTNRVQLDRFVPIGEFKF